jgi:hypothetical protein
VDYFFTDNLSGCAVYVAQEGGTNDFVVFHANARATQGTSGDGPATTQLRAMRDAAIHDYAGWLGHTVTYRGGIEKATYFTQALQNYTARKTGEGRTNVQTMGEGCNVVGFRISGAWQFWYQTWALVSYDRPDKSWGSMTKGATRTAALGQGKVLAAARFYP